MIGSTFCQVILLLPTFMFASDPKDSSTTDGYYVWNNQALVQSLRYPPSGFNSDGYQEKMMPFDNPFSSYSQFLPPPRFFPNAMPFMQPNPVGFNGYVPEIPDFGQLQNIMPGGSQSQITDNSNNQISPPASIPAMESPNIPPVPQNEPNNEVPQNEPSKYVKQTITEAPSAQQPTQPEDL